MVNLDSDQLSVVRIEPGVRQLVTAPPGTGKTTTAMELIMHLDSALKDTRMHSVIFISFSKAAVNAIVSPHRTRLNKVEIDIIASTIDSLAHSVLRNSDSLLNDFSTFDDQLQRAKDFLENNTPRELFEDVGHVIIDEAQDTYGIRKQFLMALIELLPDDCGITVLGDPMQAIYIFLDNRTTATQGSLLDDLLIDDSFKRKTLTTNYRSQGTGAKKVTTILDSNISHVKPSEQLAAVDRALSSLPVITPQRIQKTVSKSSGSTALLVRRNVEVLVASNYLKKNGFHAFPVPPRDEQKSLPAWLSDWARASGSDEFPEKDLLQYLESRQDGSFEDAINAGIVAHFPWDRTTISEIGGKYNNRHHYEPVKTNFQGIEISTIHQSKGREFDNVILLNPARLINGFGPQSPEPELAFVALTRAKSRVHALEMDLPAVKSIEPGKRVVTLDRTRRVPISIEIRPSDVEREKLYCDEPGQIFLSSLEASATLNFELVNERSPLPIYRLFIDGFQVGVTSQKFGKVVSRSVANRSGSWPRLGPVTLDGVESVLGNAKNEGAPCWLVPRPYGLSQINPTQFV